MFMLSYINIAKQEKSIYFVTYHMLTKFHISNPKSNIAWEFRYCIFVQIIHFISYSKINV